MSIKQIFISPLIMILSALEDNKKVKLVLDNCPPGFDFTKAGEIPVEQVETSVRVMKKINIAGRNSKKTEKRKIIAKRDIKSIRTDLV